MSKVNQQVNSDVEVVVVDASGQKLGRVASVIAHKLMGKDSPDYMPNRMPDVFVKVINVGAIDFSGLDRDYYKSYSGYPGSLRFIKRSKVLDEKGPEEILRRAVSGMLPKNKLRKRLLNDRLILIK